jgi:hypothetical protein
VIFQVSMGGVLNWFKGFNFPVMIGVKLEIPSCPQFLKENMLYLVPL